MGEHEPALGPEDLPKTTGLPIPDWMLPYVEPAMSGIREMPEGIEPARGRRKETTPWYEKKAFATRPLGAQAETTPEEMEMLKGRIAWAGGGAPMSIREGEAFERGLARKPQWWEEYVSLSESLFPEKKKLRSRWRR